MADKKISELPSLAELQYDSLIPVEQNGEANKLTGQQFAAFAKESVQEEVNAAHDEYLDALAEANRANTEADKAESEANRAENVASHPPTLTAKNDHWWIWDATTESYVDSGVDAGVSLAVDPNPVTLQPNQNVTVENVGTATDPVLRFSIPKGPKGDTGDMDQSVYDPQNKRQDIFQYVDNAIASIVNGNNIEY